MTGPHPAVAATRVAVRPALTEAGPGSRVLVGCSGGADSLALAAAIAFEAPRLGVVAGAVVVDHQLQPGSAEVAAAAAGQCRALGLEPVEVVSVQVTGGGSGPEAEARRARYAALEQAADRLGAAQVLLGHTRDDQAEQVLLGLVRGSGARSLAGMPARRGRLVRPFLALDRATTRAACDAQGLNPWEDPHNADETYLRVRARRLLGELEAALGPGVAAALARSADLLRQDADALDELARTARGGLGEGPWEVADLTALPRAVRTRVWRSLATEAGSPPGALFAVHVDALEALLTDWHGQGPVDLPGAVRARRFDGRVTLEPSRRVE
ncbi:tRNA lysidine(34) synthetase TilS [Oryzihumus leptocrescens]|uniref:tRNA(Ile)-lysidine synthase n=1 Tax=Oryzihumus leptocrescens TaxID=297536 RepID=A0A542ZEE3_9MICO|nr:tRNA lysidine(34) synthetase TilS [Oryzihumus leptocrescens]TQL58716.1 tRNA(Ile)-lysidine synthase [Oryzihumus leptocrescens]